VSIKSAARGKPALRVIKKYPNRRLYDTDSSAYITLTEVKQLVMDCEPFVVVDAKTGQDLTRSILLQIILEQEANGAPMFTEAVSRPTSSASTETPCRDSWAPIWKRTSRRWHGRCRRG
jgi:polyhydroxyalkanoate synthesis regulator protein